MRWVITVFPANWPLSASIGLAARANVSAVLDSSGISWTRACNIGRFSIQELISILEQHSSLISILRALLWTDGKGLGGITLLIPWVRVWHWWRMLRLSTFYFPSYFQNTIKTLWLRSCAGEKNKQLTGISALFCVHPSLLKLWARGVPVLFPFTK